MLQYVSLQSYAKIARVTALYRLTTGQQKGMNMLRIYCSILKCKSTQDTVYQSTVIPQEVCCSPTVMLIHSVLCIWCQTFTCLNFTFTVTFSSALHLGNTSIQAKYLKTVFICRFASHNRCHNLVWQIYCNYCKLKNCILQS